ncbi:hypothetical protein B0H14DRAFT_3132371, partial [Mycena olivaceomarginata]
MLSGKNDNAAVIQCFAQDPIYSDMDKQLLGKHGITVLDDPRGFLHWTSRALSSRSPPTYL